ncbi:MAG: hypothetical protein HY231_12185 [Acidobacteria bacterium]|nr:hypothetical protein [Acidobacteriota bacterium]
MKKPTKRFHHKIKPVVMGLRSSGFAELQTLPDAAVLIKPKINRLTVIVGFQNSKTDDFKQSSIYIRRKQIKNEFSAEAVKRLFHLGGVAQSLLQWAACSGEKSKYRTQ